jgi:hypothetical protein
MIITRLNVLDGSKLKKFIADNKPISIDAGVLCDWDRTADTIYEDGEFIYNNDAITDSHRDTIGFKATMENGDVIESECNIKISGYELGIYLRLRKIRNQEKDNFYAYYKD